MIAALNAQKPLAERISTRTAAFIADPGQMMPIMYADYRYSAPHWPPASHSVTELYEIAVAELKIMDDARVRGETIDPQTHLDAVACRDALAKLAGD